MVLSWLRGARKSKSRRRPAPLMLRTESLEDRAVPSATLVRDINTHTANALGFGYSNPGRSVELDGRLYFFADDGIHGRELWSTDGTDLGTQLVKDIFPGAAGSNTSAGGPELARLGEKLVFAADDGVHGTELWTSDGTAAGTQMLADIAAGPGGLPSAASSYPAQFHELDGHVYFLAGQVKTGQELWITDGTGGGTHIVRDINSGSAGSNVSGLTAFGHQLYFAADDGLGSELWATDGTAAGTHRITDIRTAHSTDDAGPLNANPANLTVVGDRLFFTADDGLRGIEVWVSDGTDAGTHIVADVNSTTYLDPHGVEKTYSSGPTQLTGLGDRLYFLATDNSAHARIWSTDGTEAGTQLLQGGDGSILNLGEPYLMASAGSQLYIAAGTSHDGVYGTELWRSDGTAAGTTRLARWDEPPYGDMPYQGLQNIVVQSGNVYVTAGTSIGSVDDAGVSFFHKFGGPNWGTPTVFGSLGDQLFIVADDGQHGFEIWSVAGANVAMLKDINSTTLPSTPRQLLTIGAVTYFVADDGENGAALWRTDGTTAGTVLVRSFFPPPSSAGSEVAPMPWPAGSRVGHLTNFNGTLFFTAGDALGRDQLWMSDGTEAGTVMLTNADAAALVGNAEVPGAAIAPSAGDAVGNLTPVGADLFFTRSSDWNHTELWVTDGTPGGTELVRAFSSMNRVPPPTIATAASASALPWVNSLLDNLTELDGVLFFSADDGASGTELWRSDGTAAGTRLVKDINPNGQPPSAPGGVPIPAGSDPENLTVLDGRLYFSADDGAHGRELWASDGTEAGTQLLVDLAAGAAGSMLANVAAGAGPVGMLAAGGKLYFNADDGVHGQELWISDGSAAGTALVRNIHPDDATPPEPGAPAIMGSGIQSLTRLGSAIYFSANDGEHGQELWKSDGTAAGTVLVRDIFTGMSKVSAEGPDEPNSSLPGSLTDVNGRLYFTATDAAHGTELWTSDGTEAGTTIAAEINPGPMSSFQPLGFAPPTDIVALGDQVLFGALGAAQGDELFAAEAEPIGTIDLSPLSAGGPYQAVEGGTLELHGSIANRPDANRLRFAWDLDGDGAYDDARGPDPTMVGAQLRALGLFGGPAAHSIGLRVTDAAGQEVGSATAQVQVEDSPLVASGVSLDVTEGQGFNRNVASFKDPGGFEDLTHYSATIDWGDGQTSVGTVIRDGSNLRVAGAHAYETHGHYSVEVQIQDDGGTAVAAMSTVLVHDAALYAGRTFARATAARPLTDTVATFRDMNPNGNAGEFSAEIDWGDGSTSTGNIVAGSGGYQVVGTHTYALAGDFAVKVTIHSAGGSSATALSVVRVDSVHLVPRGLTATASALSEATLNLAAFRDSDRAATAALYSVLIDWADGTTSAGSVVADGSDGFRVTGVHRYDRAGLFSVRVTIQDSTGQSASTMGTVRVVGAP